MASTPAPPLSVRKNDDKFIRVMDAMIVAEKSALVINEFTSLAGVPEPPLPPCTPKVHVAIVGSRSLQDYVRFRHIMDELQVAEKADLIISGGAIGADTLAARFAAEAHIRSLVLRPDWRRLGRSAGLKRNTEIVNKASWVIAFWDGSSRGTADTIAKAKHQGKKLNVVRF